MRLHKAAALSSALALTALCASIVTAAPVNYGVWGSFNPETDADTERLLAPAHFRKVERADGAAPDKPSAEDLKRGFAIFPAGYISGIQPEDGTAPRLNATVAPDEYGSFMFGLMALEDLDSVRVNITGLSAPEGVVMPADNFDVRVVRRIYKRLRAAEGESWKRYWDNPSYALLPVVLEKRPSVDLKEGTTTGFWVSLYAPVEQRPGVYSGQLSIETRTASLKLPFEVTVLPFTLSAARADYGLFYSAASGDPNYAGNIDKEFIDIREHGFNSLSFMSVPAIKKTGPGISFDFSRDMGNEIYGLDRLMEAYRAANLTGPVNYAFMTNRLIDSPMGGWKGMKLYSDEFDKRYRALVEAVISRYPDETFYFGIDEPAGNKKAPARYYLRLLKSMPGVQTMAELNGLSWGFDDATYFSPYVDRECYQRKSRNFFTLLRKASVTGKPLCVYNSGSMGTDPKVDRYAMGLDAWRLEAGDVWQWNYHQGNDFGWLGKDGRWHNRDKELGIRRTYMAYSYGYPAPDGPVPSIAWEAARHGVNDARYISTLESLIEKANGLDTDEAKEAASEAASFLDGLKKSLPVEYSERERFIEGLKPSFFDTTRAEVTKRILRITEIWGKR